MATDISICNAALLMIGAEEIESFSDSTRQAKMCAALYETEKQSLLQAHPWRFSLNQIQLAQLVATPLYGYSYAYQLPPDMLRLIGTKHKYDYRIFEDMLYTDQTEVYVTYQFDPGEENFPAYFVKTLQLQLASVFAMSIAEDTSKASLFEQRWAVDYRKARNIDSQNYPNMVLPANNFALTHVRH